jgi:16S rRNA processing protein RimM
VTKPQGLTGAVRVELFLDDDRAFAAGRIVSVKTKSGERDQEIESFRRQSGRPVLKLRGVNDRSAAEAIVGAELWMTAGHLPRLSDGSFYTFDLKGCDVYVDPDRRLGTVVDVLDAAGSGLLRIDHDGKELLVPFAAAFLKRIDIEGKRIDLNLPEGLLELNSRNDPF